MYKQRKSLSDAIIISYLFSAPIAFGHKSDMGINENSSESFYVALIYKMKRRGYSHDTLDNNKNGLAANMNTFVRNTEIRVWCYTYINT